MTGAFAGQVVSSTELCLCRRRLVIQGPRMTRLDRPNDPRSRSGGSIGADEIADVISGG